MKTLTKKNIKKINKVINSLKKAEVTSDRFVVIEDYDFDYDTDEAEAEFFGREPMYEEHHQMILDCYSEEFDYPQEMEHSDKFGHCFFPTTYLANAENHKDYFNLNDEQKLLLYYFRDEDLDEEKCENFLLDFTDFFNWERTSALYRDTLLDTVLIEVKARIM